jgi:hypothetical protein
MGEADDAILGVHQCCEDLKRSLSDLLPHGHGVAQALISTTDCRDDGDYCVCCDSGRQSTCVSNVFFTNEDVDVRPNFTLLRNNAISHAGTEGP